ncbi:MAG: T9SS type A sorting domain-containing protein [Saprospiraceae bacterium]
MKLRILLFVFSLLCIDCFGQVGFEQHNVIIESTTESAKSVFAIDIDGDGDNDILSASLADGHVAWYENLDGEGNFGLQHVVNNDSDGAIVIYAADLDTDGDNDIIAVFNWNGLIKIVWYKNLDGLGDFGPELLLAGFSLNNQPQTVYSADFDGDGDIDVITGSTYDDKINILENSDGQGNFILKQTITSADDVRSVFASDIDGDGDMDILSASRIDNKIAWYENSDGLGNFDTEQIISVDAEQAYSVYSSDVDGDGDMDVISASVGDDKIAWYENTDGQGNFSDQNIISTSADGAYSVHSSDLDGDGDMDILSASVLDDKVAWYKNLDGQGNFSAEQIISTDSDFAISVFSSDLDGDGDMDVLSASESDDKVVWYKNTDGLGDFSSEINPIQLIDFPRAVFAADLDGDSDMDILCASEEDNKISWYENIDGQGNFIQQNILTSTAQWATTVVAGDIDNDGDMDVIAGSYGHVFWFENMDGAADFSGAKIITSSIIETESVFVADIDGDGDLDVLAASSGDSKIKWYENVDGLGNFDSGNNINFFAENAQSVFAQDLDNDGDMDVISGSSGDNIVAWYENLDGLGDFSLKIIITEDVDYVTSVSSADIDGDGDNDVISVSRNDGKIAWYRNDGMGNFSDQMEIFSNTSFAIHASTTDIDMDGDLDIILSSYSGDLEWFENLDGMGTFGTNQIIEDDFYGTIASFPADINGDGKVDIVGGFHFSSTINWYENIGVISNEINGSIKLQTNAIECDVSSPLLENILVVTENANTSRATFTLSNGTYQLFPNDGNFTTSVNSVLPSYFSVNPNSHSSTFVGLDDVETLDFCIEPNQTINDLNITLFPLSEARPGFNSSYQLVYHNMGTTQLSGNVMLSFDDTKLTFLSATETIAAQTANAISFDYTDLNPFETRTIDLHFNILPPPTVNIDEILNFTATIDPIVGDFTEADNVFDLSQTVIGSYDPNDITVLEGDKVLIANADKYLHYIIRFQNTGTASAINVRVENILDDNLDWQTMQLESSSHTNRVEIIDGSQLTFIFNGINLPDSTSNEPESHGFIAYKIKLKSDIQVGDMISSTADIYFDFNEAVVTNTVITEIVEPVSINKNALLQFSIYPIPTSGILSVQTETHISQIEIYDRLGQLQRSNFNKKEIDLSGLSSGFYFCKIKDIDGNSGVKKVVKE